ncbi:DUF3604 domain-containing protein [Ruegeria pomeroyi]|nr:DUF3604 domain-containing protein [Ruegeria pomeroyi]MCE8523570.1 DUF3604 domain-containing protein [Ruegeria pomeroyi]MCE8527580.1 DUF3604 domain-containing protein [Ruegeria pomeroyi]MCE8531723.1 DUF3604 domain-containing protein [Ruegeria pomeroyi]MCE8535803.1 DUF3604 domain-containing protein [Ruegeria pomeroyi]
MKQSTYAGAWIFLLWPVALTAQTYVGDVAIQEDDVELGARHYSPYLDQSYPNRVFFGDTHLHTSYSTDAGMIGNVLGPDDAFRFARGEKVRASMGTWAQLVRPLDFLVVADHAENLGLAPMIAESNPGLLANDWGRKLHDMVKGGDPIAAYVEWGAALNEAADMIQDDNLQRTMWNRIVDSAERFNEPGVFTALHGFEWSSGPEANNLHRVVMFRDDAEKVEDLVPFSTYDSTDPEDLWDWLEAYEENTGGQVMAFAHNGNLSNGLMFDDVRMNGEPLDIAYAERRARWEPVYEVTQMKGDGETHPMLSPNDEFANYYTWDRGNFGTELKTPDMLPREYARQALARGLKYAEHVGANPFKFGLIGATDSHTSLAATREDNFFGKASIVEPGTGEARYEDFIVQPVILGEAIAVRHYEALASGLAAVWARENTREAIWDAFKRKEVYATTGSRMTVRVFAGWDFQEHEVHRPDFAATGYARGVPMGADLFAGPVGAAPTFMVRALRDPDGANLDRIQIVKGWLGNAGEPQTKVFDVAWSGDREPDAEGKLPPVGSTVNGADFTNTIGAAALGGHWVDPEFDPSQRAYYYVRVLEIPTPSWLAYDEAFYGPLDLPEDAVMVQQDRAYTSPVWYAPG